MARLVDLYNLALRLYPNGYKGKRYLALTVNDYKYHLRYVTTRGNGNDIDFNLFVPDTNYARQSITLWWNGDFKEDSEGIIPDFDLTENEPTAQCPYDVLLAIHAALLKLNQNKK